MPTSFPCECIETAARLRRPWPRNHCGALRHLTSPHWAAKLPTRHFHKRPWNLRTCWHQPLPACMRTHAVVPCASNSRVTCTSVLHHTRSNKTPSTASAHHQDDDQRTIRCTIAMCGQRHALLRPASRMQMSAKAHKHQGESVVQRIFGARFRRDQASARVAPLRCSNARVLIKQP
jgi:hypothetical protein